MTEPTPLRPAEVFFNLIVSFLAPMFLASCGGNHAYALMAATQTVNAYAARNPTDLLPIAQVIALGFAVLDSLSRSMEETLPISLVLRLRSNAASLNRGAEQCRRILHAPPIGDAASQWPGFDQEQDQQHEAAAIASLAQAERQLTELGARHHSIEPPNTGPLPANLPTPIAQRAATQPTAAAPPANPAAPTQADYRNAWAAAMTRVAREYTDNLPSLPPVERRDATMRATILSSVARDLLSGQPMPPPFDLGTRPPTPRRAAHP
jgi:hypothetical protein